MTAGHSQSSSVASPNIRFVGHSDQGGKSDGVQVMVHRGYAYIGHTFSNGITIVDVRDPAHRGPSSSSPARPTRGPSTSRPTTTCSSP